MVLHVLGLKQGLAAQEMKKSQGKHSDDDNPIQSHTLKHPRVLYELSNFYFMDGERNAPCD